MISLIWIVIKMQCIIFWHALAVWDARNVRPKKFFASFHTLSGSAKMQAGIGQPGEAKEKLQTATRVDLPLQLDLMFE